MRTIETTVTVGEDGRITVPVAAAGGLPPGRYRAVLVLEAAPEPGPAELHLHTFPLAAFPADCRFSREDLYDDSGR